MTIEIDGFPWLQAIEKEWTDKEDLIRYLSPEPHINRTRGIKWYLNGDPLPEVFSAWKEAEDRVDDLMWASNVLRQFVRIRRHWYWRWWYRLLYALRRQPDEDYELE